MDNPKYIQVMRQVASDFDGISHELFQVASDLERTPHTSCVSPSRSIPRSQYPRAHARSVLSSKGGVASFFTSQGAQECTG